MPGKFGKHRHRDENNPTALPEANIVDEFPDLFASIEEATRPTGKAVNVRDDGKSGGVYVYRHPSEPDRYRFGTAEGPLEKHPERGWIDAETVQRANEGYGDKGWRPVR